MTATENGAPMREMPGDLPYEIEAEQAVLGAMMMSREALVTGLAQITKPGLMFYRPQHQLIFAAMEELARNDCPVDPISVTNAMLANDTLSKIPNGGTYFQEIMRATPTVANIDYYADVVIGHYKRRSVAVIGDRLAQLGRDRKADPDAVVTRGLDLLTEAVEVVESADCTGTEALVSVLEQIELAASQKEAPGLKVPWVDVEHALRTRPRKGQVITVAGMSGSGKSIAMLQIATAAIDQGWPVYMWGLEMDRNETMSRIIANKGKITHELLMDGSVLNSPDLERRLQDAAAWVTKNDHLITINDASKMPLSAVIAKLRQRKIAGKPAGLLVIDYVQLLPSDTDRERHQIVAETTRAVKRIARELDLIIVMGSQLNDDGKVRESRAIEHDSDLVLTLRPLDIESGRAGETDMKIAKWRHGPSGAVIPLAFQGHYCRFGDITTATPPPDQSGNTAADRAAKSWGISPQDRALPHGERPGE